MIPSQHCYDLIKKFEGCELVSYPDPATGDKPWTIGYGHTKDVVSGMTISQEQADEFLKEDVIHSVETVNRLVTTDLKQCEFDALVDFVYNCGQGNFAGSTLLKKINANDMEGAALEFQKWNKANGTILAGLIRRRLAEKELFKG